MELDLLSTIRFGVFRRLDLDLTVYRNSTVTLRERASLTGRGELHVGPKWPAYCADRTLLAVWDDGTLIVDGKFQLFTGTRVVVDRGARLELGSGYVNCHSAIACFKDIRIGDDVAIAENVVIRDSDNHSIVGSRHEMTQPIVIGNHVWIGMNCNILKGVTIGDGAVIAAGSVVNKDVPANVLAGGVPARVIRERIEWR
jgi:serine acetyltransferase